MQKAAANSFLHEKRIRADGVVSDSFGPPSAKIPGRHARPYSEPLNSLSPRPYTPEQSSEPLSRCILKAGLRLGPAELLHLELQKELVSRPSFPLRNGISAFVSLR